MRRRWWTGGPRTGSRPWRGRTIKTGLLLVNLGTPDAPRPAQVRTYLREFRKQKPVILYANDADFQQTNVIGGLIGQGTGGVTESLKERVVMPLTGLYAETDHDLGHELVHSFQ